MCGCAGGWKGCEACALSAAMISTVPFILDSVSQTHAWRVNLGASHHHTDASSLNGKLTSCSDLEWPECGGWWRCGLTFRMLTVILNKGCTPVLPAHCPHMGQCRPLEARPLPGDMWQYVL